MTHTECPNCGWEDELILFDCPNCGEPILDEHEDEFLKEITDTKKTEEAFEGLFGLNVSTQEAENYMDSYFPSNNFEEFLAN